MKRYLLLLLALLTACNDGGGSVEATWVARLEIEAGGGLAGLTAAPQVHAVSDGGAYVVSLSGRYGVFRVAPDGTTPLVLAPASFATADAAVRGDALLLLGTAGPGAAVGGSSLDPGPAVVELSPAGEVLATTPLEPGLVPVRVAATPDGGFAVVAVQGDRGGAELVVWDADGAVVFRQALGVGVVASDLTVDPVGGDVFVVANFGGTFTPSDDVALASSTGSALALARWGGDGSLRFARQSLGSGSFSARFVGPDVVLDGFGSRTPYVLGFDGTSVSKPSVITVDVGGAVTVDEQLDDVVHPSATGAAVADGQYREGRLRADPTYDTIALEIDRVLTGPFVNESLVTVRRHLGGAAAVVDLTSQPPLIAADVHPVGDAVWLTMRIDERVPQTVANRYGTGFIVASFPL